MVSSPTLLDAGTARRALAGFFLSGLLFSFLGAILPAWGYHLKSDYSTVGSYFFSLNLGILMAALLPHRLLVRAGVRASLLFACSLAFVSLLYLSFVTPPAPYYWRMLGLFFVGTATGMLNTAIFHGISSAYQHARAATVNLAGVLFGLGSLVTALLVAGTFYVYTVPSILFLIAIVPAFFAIMYARWPAPPALEPAEPASVRVFRDARSLPAVLFTILLFFQFGNEWAIAGWLPLFLVQRLGVSPATSLWLLAWYWLALLVGRLATQALLPLMSHGRLMFSSVLSAIFGCIILIFTDNTFGAAVGLLFTGGGFATIYPLTVEMIGHRFPYYHPGYFNGIFSFALSGALLAPWTLGFFADWWGIQVVMALPLLGTIMVFVLLLLIWLESKLSGPAPTSSEA